MNAKQRAANAAIPFLKSGMTIGLGTGSTADCFLYALGDALKAGRLTEIRGVATSQASYNRAIELDIPVVDLGDVLRCDIVVDGADEVSPALDVIKGLGGALLREKIVAQNSGRVLIIADASKRVDRLGTKSPLPVEVTQFSHAAHVPFFKSLGANPVLRCKADGAPFITDNGNYIYDCRFAGIDDPAKLQAALKNRAGVVETGLFLGLVTNVLIADDAGVTQLNR